jgi:hypothetical protein
MAKEEKIKITEKKNPTRTPKVIVFPKRLISHKSPITNIIKQTTTSKKFLNIRSSSSLMFCERNPVNIVIY